MSLTVSYCILHCYMSLTVYHYFFLLSVTVSPSAMEFVHVCHSLLWVWLSLSVSLSFMELLRVSHFLSRVLAVSYYLLGSMEFLAVSHCVTFLLAFSHCLFQFQGVFCCLSLSPLVAC